MIKAIAFDKDGTLLDFHATWHSISLRLAFEAARGDKQQAMRLLEAGGYDAHNNRFKPNSIIAAGTAEDIVMLWYPELQGQAFKEKIAYYNNEVAIEGAENSVAVRDLYKTLQDLHKKNISLGIITNDSFQGASLFAERMDITPFIKSILGYDSVESPKPHPEPLLKFAQHCEVDMSEVAMVGDNLHDLEMAKRANAGLIIGVLTGTGNFDDLDELADVVLPSIAELPKWLEASAKMIG